MRKPARSKGEMVGLDVSLLLRAGFCNVWAHVGSHENFPWNGKRQYYAADGVDARSF